MKKHLSDIHMHLLWGIDDGPKTREEMHEMLDEAHRQGYERIYATSHVCPGFRPFDFDLYLSRLEEAREYCIEKGYSIEIMQGAEIAWTHQAADALLRGAVPALGRTDYVLLELWPGIPYQEALRAVRTLVGAGYIPILSHVERYQCFRWSPRKALRFREETGALFQMNAQTLLKPFSLACLYFRNRLMKSRAIDFVASDAHGVAGRPVNLDQAYDWLLQHTDKAYADRLTGFGQMMNGSDV